METIRADVCASPWAQAAELRLSCDVPGDVSEDQLREMTCKGKEGAGASPARTCWQLLQDEKWWCSLQQGPVVLPGQDTGHHSLPFNCEEWQVHLSL